MKFLLFLTFLSGSFTVSSQDRPFPGTGKAILLSDIHFNPFSQPELFDSLNILDGTDWEGLFERHPLNKIPGDGEDCNYALFQSLIHALQADTNRADFMIINGDYLSHHFEENFIAACSLPEKKYDFKSFVYKTIRFLASGFDKAFPTTVIVAVIGNNDTDTTDYYWRADRSFLKIFASAWIPLLRQPAKEQLATRQQFLAGGYYSFRLNKGTGKKIIALNSVLFHDAMSYGKYARQGKAQLEWLQATLRDGIPCWMAYHIPPGVDVYKTDKNRSEGGHMFWEEKLTKSFFETVSRAASSIRINLVSHTHKDDFRILYTGLSEPVSVFHFIPSVSQSNHNNPSYQVCYFNPENFTVTGYDKFFLNTNGDQKIWAAEYNFGKTYGETEITPRSMHHLLNRLNEDRGLRNLFIKYYNSSFLPEGTAIFKGISDNWETLYSGAMQFLLKEPYEKYLRN